jgi:hypothetical protein
MRRRRHGHLRQRVVAWSSLAADTEEVEDRMELDRVRRFTGLPVVEVEERYAGDARSPTDSDARRAAAIARCSGRGAAVLQAGEGASEIIS